MLKTFNCGVGFCLIVSKAKINKIYKYFSKDYKPYIIGKIINGEKKIILNEKVEWNK